MLKVYSRINWDNYPNTNTPLGAVNLNYMDYAIDEIDNRVISLYGYESRVSQSEANAKTSENNAKTSEINAKQSELNAKESEELAKQYMENAFSTTPEGYEQLVIDVGSLEIQTSTDTTIEGTVAGGLKFNSVAGASVQDGTPTPDAPIDIENAVVSEIKSFGKNLVDFSNLSNATTNVTNCAYDKATNKLSFDYSGRYPSVRWSLSKFKGKTVKFIDGGRSNSNSSANSTIQILATLSDGTTKYSSRTALEGDGWTIPSSCKSVHLEIYGNNQSTSQSGTFTVTEPMLYLASENNSFEPYKETSITLSEPITLNGINDVKDQIVKQNGVWGVLRRHSEVTFDGKEYWYAQQGKEYYRVGTDALKETINYAGNSASTIANILCDSYVAITPNDTWLNNSGISVDEYGALFIYDENFNTSDVSLWTSHLSEHPITALYELAKPIFEELPITDQIALNSLETFDGVTNIVFDSTIEPSIEVEYGTSKNSANTLKALNGSEHNLKKNAVVNNLATTQEGFVLDARQGKALQDQLDSNIIFSLDEVSAIKIGRRITIEFNGISTSDFYDLWSSLYAQYPPISDGRRILFIQYSGKMYLGQLWFLATGSCAISIMTTYGTLPSASVNSSNYLIYGEMSYNLI